MSRRGFTFIELMISAAILAGVLISTFTVYAVINRNGRTAQRLRADSYDTATLVGMVRDYGRYASPWLNEDDQPICTYGLTADQLGALREGVYAGSDTTWVSVRNANAVGDTSGYTLYGFVFTRELPDVATTIGTVPKYVPTLAKRVITAGASGLCTIAQQADSQLLPGDLRVVRDATWQLVTVTRASVDGSGSVGPISLTVSPNRLPRLVELHLAVVNTSALNRAPLEYQTAFTTRSFASEFVAL